MADLTSSLKMSLLHIMAFPSSSNKYPPIDVPKQNRLSSQRFGLSPAACLIFVFNRCMEVLFLSILRLWKV